MKITQNLYQKIIYQAAIDEYNLKHNIKTKKNLWQIVSSIFAYLADRFLRLVSSSYCQQKEWYRCNYCDTQMDSDEILELEDDELSWNLKAMASKAKNTARWSINQLCSFYTSNKVDEKIKVKTGFLAIAGGFIGIDYANKAQKIWNKGHKITAVKVAALGGCYAVMGLSVTLLNWMKEQKL